MLQPFYLKKCRLSDETNPLKKSDFKYKSLSSDDIFFRVFTRKGQFDGELKNWNYFDQSQNGRFNGCSVTPPPEAFGTLYAAETVKGALSESIFRRHETGHSLGISKKLLQIKWLVQFTPKKEIWIVDLTAESNRNLLDIDKQIFTTPDYSICHSYAHCLRELGFDGIYYESRNSNHFCYAFFPGTTSEEYGEVLGPLEDVVLEECLQLSRDKGIPFI